MSDLTDLKKQIELYNDKVQNNIEIVSKEDLGQDFLLHISGNKLTKTIFVPWISRRQGNTEDRTVPRITCSNDLYGCLLGHAAIDHVIFDSIGYKPIDLPKFYIYSLGFDLSLKPNGKLVYDADRTNEHWLTTYNKDTVEYKGNLIGKMFVSEYKVTTTSKYKNSSQVSLTLIVSIDKDMTIKFRNNIVLEKGYYIIDNVPSVYNNDVGRIKNIEVKTIDRSEFEILTKKHIGMLEFKEKSLVKW